MVLNMRSSSTEPSTITITSSANFKNSPNSRRPPKRSTSCQNSFAEGKGRGGLSSGSSSESSLLLAVLGFASYAAFAAGRLAALASLSRALLGWGRGVRWWDCPSGGSC